MRLQRSIRHAGADPVTPVTPEVATAPDGAATHAVATDAHTDPLAHRAEDLAVRARDLQAAVAQSATATGRQLERRRRMAAFAARVWWRTLKVAFRMPPPSTIVAGIPRRRAGAAPPIRRAGQLAGAFAAGGTAAYLLDPELGARRRRRLRDTARARSRRAGRGFSRRTRYAAGHARGVAHDLTLRPAAAADDRTLADRVRTDIFRRPDAPKGDVVIGVSDGIVYLRGEVPNEEELHRLVDDARKVPGVREVESLLHTTGRPAPRDGGAA